MTKTFYSLALAIVLPLLTPTQALACWDAVCPDYSTLPAQNDALRDGASMNRLVLQCLERWLPGPTPAVETPAVTASEGAGSLFQTGAVFNAVSFNDPQVMGSIGCTWGRADQ